MNIFTWLFPILIFSIEGDSMSPTFSQGQRVVGWRFGKVKVGDIVTCKDPRNGRLLLKRVMQIKDNTFFLEGDNKARSTDSRNFGWINKKDILAKVIYPVQ